MRNRTDLKHYFWGANLFIVNRLIEHVPFHCIRRLAHTILLKIQIGPRSSLQMRQFFYKRGGIHIGSNVVINHDCVLDGRGGLTIEDHVSVSPRCVLLTMGHDAKSKDFKLQGKQVLIKRYAWLGFGCLILPGVTVGEGAIVGAGSVVTKDVQPYSIVAGNPAKEIGHRRTDLEYDLYYRPFMW